MNFTVIETGGKQYIIAPGTKIKVEKLDALVEGNVSFDHVLLRVNAESVEIGMPYLANPVQGKILLQGREKKKLIFRYHSKTRYRKKKGHRQPFTEVEIF